MYPHCQSVCLSGCLSEVRDLVHIIPITCCSELTHLGVRLYNRPLNELHDFSILRSGCVLTPSVTRD